MSICIKCGTHVGEGAHVCSFCGAPVKEEAPLPQAALPEEKSVEEPFYPRVLLEDDEDDGMPVAHHTAAAIAEPRIPKPVAGAETGKQPAPEQEEEAVLSVWGFTWSLFLMLIPVLGLAVALFWSFGGSRRINRRNLARGMIVLWLASILVFVIAYLCSGAHMIDLFHKIYTVFFS